jgi:cyclophilin family peptidyl-prolyl cis-trans isomerase
MPSRTPPPMTIDATKQYGAVVETDCGPFTISLDAKRAPVTVNNFVALARAGYFDGVNFHRVIPGFVVQGGDPTGTGRGDPGYRFADELPPPADPQYPIGSLAMANAGPDTNGSQFFIVTGPAGENLPPHYSLFGHVIEGMEVVAAIEADGDRSGEPKVVHSMTKVTIFES